MIKAWVVCLFSLFVFVILSQSAAVGSESDDKTFIQTGTGAVMRTTHDKLKDFVTVKDFGAVGNGTENDSPAIQAAFDSGAGTIYIPSGKYLLNTALIIPNSLVVIWDSRAYFKAGSNNMVMLRATTSAYASQLISPNLDGNGKTGITGMDLIRFSTKAVIYQPRIINMDTGIYLRELCWDLVIDNPSIYKVTNPIIVTNGSNAVDIRHPAIDTFGSIGISVSNGANYQTTSVQVTGGYIQHGGIGINDASWGLRINNVYFETCTVADIYLSASRFPLVNGTQHFSKGMVAIKGRHVLGGRISNTLMASGGRTIGLYDFDATNSQSYEDHQSGDSVNSPIGIVTGLSKLAYLTESATGEFLVQKGLNFQAVQVSSVNPNTLDDYREGTFQPIFSNLSVVNGTGGVTYAGSYTKVGNLVCFKVRISTTGSATTSATNGLTTFSGIPYSGEGVANAAFSGIADNSISGTGLIDKSGKVYLPTWTAKNASVIISGCFTTR